MEEGEIIFLPVKVQEGHLSEEVKIMVNLSQTGLDVLPNKYHNFISWIYSNTQKIEVYYAWPLKFICA